MNKELVVKTLQEIVSKKNVITNQNDLDKFNNDWRGYYNFKSICAVLPESVIDIKKIIKFCSQENIKIVPQAGNTSLTGASVPSKNDYEIILNCKKMNKILSIDKDNLLIEVEAGATLDSVKEYASKNNFYFPNLYINGVDFQQDDDGDYMFNPGETVRVKVTVGNSWGGDAVNVVLTLSSEDPRIYISDDTIEFSNPIEAGDVTFTLLDWFLVSANSNATPGDVPCTVTITAGTEEYPYELVEEIELNLTLSQYGFPVEGIVIKSSPILADLDGNTLKDIYFGAENDKLYGYTIAGLTTAGFPFSTNDRVRSSPAIGDVDQDGSDELVFGELESMEETT